MKPRSPIWIPWRGFQVLDPSAILCLDYETNDFTFYIPSIMKPLQRIAVVGNATKDGAGDIADRLETLAKAEGLEVELTMTFPPPDDLLAEVDACFVVGGDGTLLNMMKQAVRHDVPIAGVRHGQLGFLATFSPEEMEHTMPGIFRGGYEVRRRSMLSYAMAGGEESFALNDLVVKSGSKGRLARFSVHAESELVADYACDGIVFSTPTGSTAYNLAAGGPIVHPGSEVMMMTPISAHTLTSRSVVFPAGISLSVDSKNNPDEPLFSADGQPAFASSVEFPVQVSVSVHSFPLLEESGHSHFRVLRNKMKWG